MPHGRTHPALMAGAEEGSHCGIPVVLVTGYRLCGAGVAILKSDAIKTLLTNIIKQALESRVTAMKTMRCRWRLARLPPDL